MAAGRPTCPHAGIDTANPIVVDVDATPVTAHSRDAVALFPQDLAQDGLAAAAGGLGV